MSDSKVVVLPGHLWEALDLMAQEMGVGRDALVSQAVFMLARLNGYVVAGKVAAGVGGTPIVKETRPPTAPLGAPKKGAGARKPPEPEPEPEAAEDESNPFDEQQSQQQEYEEEPLPEEPEEQPQPPRGGKASLTLVVAGRDPYRLTGDVMTIGRGKSCEFVIESNRVSREHVRITREGTDFIIEDLNSSNGTFFGPQKEKIARRKLKDGDEYTLGTEKIRFQIRK